MYLNLGLDYLLQVVTTVVANPGIKMVATGSKTEPCVSFS